VQAFRYLLVVCLVAINLSSNGQLLNRYRTGEMELIYVGNRYSYLMPHAAGSFHNAIQFHKKHWDYQHKKTYVFLTDFEDDGHGGAITMPHNMVFLGIAPANFAFSIIPSSERFQWLFNHELTHITLADKPNQQDLLWRKVLFGKVLRDDLHPVSGLMSYLTSPRWYAPRWYHEGIACYMETWMSGGLGRALGAYDEMYFRSIILENEKLYTPVGLETEGSTVDFQVGANAYLYGTRFVTYLSQRYGHDQVRDLYNRTDDSKAFYGNQFKKVFGKSVSKSWDDWIAWEQEFQKNNLNTLRKVELTTFKPITGEALGSFSNVGYDAANSKIYAAVNHPGDISRIIELDIKSGDIKKIAILDAPMLYNVTFLAYHPGKKIIFFSEGNSKYRSLYQVDIQSGKKERLIKYSRTGNLTVNEVDHSLWGIQHDNGYATLVKIPEPYHEVVPMYTADFGKSLFDLDISNDGKRLIATLTGIAGEQTIIQFNLENLEAGKKSYETIYKLDDNTLTQFRFSPDDQFIVGSSYYTGVSNIWRIRLEDRSFELLSNDESGLFMPVQISEDSLFVLKFRRDGMQPGLIPLNVLPDANSIQFLGNLAYEKNPQVFDYSLPPASRVNLDSLLLDEAPYDPIKNMAISGSYPDLAGYKESLVLGYRLNLMDRMGLSSFSLFLGASPWSQYEEKQQWHAELKWTYWSWTFNAAWNKAHFYDLFGPTKRSRAGYTIGLSQEKTFIQQSPFKWHYTYGINHYGGLEVLPQYQEVDISSQIQSFQSVQGEIGVSHLRRTLGGVEDEKGYFWNLIAYSYFLPSGDWNGSSVYPSLISEQHYGCLVPWIRNTSFWVRNSLGASLNPDQTPFSNFYFGGFRNNWVDWQPASQYRKVFAFPGVDIDGLAASHFVKTIAELNLRPVRMRNVGTTWLYPTYLKPALFSSHISLNPLESNQVRNVYNAGAQLDLELVLFAYLKTTWSVGYAQYWEPSQSMSGGQWMFSIKLLGN
jgi:hypothetical protein